MKKLRHKVTGEVINSKELLTDEFITDLFSKDFNYLQSKLEKIQDVWEVYEEKKFWYIYAGHVFEGECDNAMERMLKATANYFKTKEEAVKAVEKLKAWKRLKDKKIFIYRDHFDYRSQDGSFNVEFGDKLSNDEVNQVNDDLDLLFGDEE